MAIVGPLLVLTLPDAIALWMEPDWIEVISTGDCITGPDRPLRKRPLVGEGGAARKLEEPQGRKCGPCASSALPTALNSKISSGTFQDGPVR